MIPEEVWEQLKEFGLFGQQIPEEYGTSMENRRNQADQSSFWIMKSFKHFQHTHSSPKSHEPPRQTLSERN